MGYTHYWRLRDSEDAIRKQYLEALPRIRKIVATYRDILQRDYDDTAEPEVSEEMIWFNGIDEDGHETFVFKPGVVEFAFCKTARKEYDLPVCLCLLVLDTCIEKLSLSSDGFDESYVDVEWVEAYQKYDELFGEPYEGNLSDVIYKNMKEAQT